MVIRKIQLLLVILTSVGININTASALYKKEEAPPGVIITHQSKGTGKYIGSPSIAILPNGDYVASHDFFGPKSNSSEKGKSTAVIYRSSDSGKTWGKAAEITNAFWSKLFVHNKILYFIGPDNNHGNYIIRKSVDGGYTWTIPSDEKNGILLKGKFHTAPTPIVSHNGKLWKALEFADGPIQKWGKRYGAAVISIDEDKDLLVADNWKVTKVMYYDSTYLKGNFGGWLEGSIVVGPNNKLKNILRVDYRAGGMEKAGIIGVSENGYDIGFNPETDFIDFPGGCKKFTVLQDPKTKIYWTLSNYVPLEFIGINPERTRNTLALMRSKDLYNWEVQGIVLHHPDIKSHGYQYVDFLFEENDIVFVSRTAHEFEEENADNQHNANLMTFHRIKNYTQYRTPKKWKHLIK